MNTYFLKSLCNFALNVQLVFSFILKLLHQNFAVTNQLEYILVFFINKLVSCFNYSTPIYYILNSNCLARQIHCRFHWKEIEMIDLKRCGHKLWSQILFIFVSYFKYVQVLFQWTLSEILKYRKVIGYLLCTTLS